MIVEALSDFWMIKRSGQIANNIKKMVSDKRQVSTKNCLRFVAARHLCVKCVFNEYFYKVVPMLWHKCHEFKAIFPFVLKQN